MEETVINRGEVEGLQAHCQTVPKHVVFGPERNGASVVCEGIVKAPQFLERGSHIVVNLGQIGLDGESLAVASDGVIQPP